MIFRPSDDVLDQNGQIIPQNNEFMNQNAPTNGENQVFNVAENTGDSTVTNLNPDNIVIPDVEMEEVKAPDLSDLLMKDSSSASTETTEKTENIESENSIENKESSEIMVNQNEDEKVQIEDNSVVPENNDGKQENVVENLEPNNEVNKENVSDNSQNDGKSGNAEIEESIPGKMSDEERIKLVSNIEGSIHSNLDLLVNEQWYNTILKYRKVHRIVFKRGLFIFSALVGVLIGTLCQVSAGNSNNYQIIKDDSIENMSSWRDSDMPNVVLKSLEEKGVKVIIPYGTAKMDGKSFQSRSNLISYNGVILPQIASINYEKNKFSMGDFEKKNLNRSDLETLLEVLVNDNITKKTKDLRNPFDMKRMGQNFDGGLEDFFNLKCLDSTKFSDFVCDDFLKIFNKYGKYYNLYEHASELLSYVEHLEEYNKDIIPICDMVKEYSVRAGMTYVSDFASIMNKCGEDYRDYYKKMTNFIEVENSMNQPEIPEKVYDDPDINAYKLISSWQNVSKFLNGTVNKNYIKSYLKFVKTLIDKDKGTNKYISPLYKDLLYIFNTDELYTKLLNKGDLLSSDIKSLMDQINNGDGIGGYSLVSLLTTPNIVNDGSGPENPEIERLPIEEMFSQYYNMKDKLKIRKVDKISDDEIRLQSEITSNAIKSKVGDEQGDSLKATVSLKRMDNLLYVDNIKIANQQKLTDILNIYAKDETVTLNAMLVYIDEQVGFWYNSQVEEISDNPTFCDKLEERLDVELQSCDDSLITLTKGDVEYKFEINNGILNTFEIGDDNLNSKIKDNLIGVIMTKDNTAAIIESIIEFVDESEDEDFDKKMQVIDQFRLYFKIIPEIESVEGDLILVSFTLGEFDLQAYYDVNTQILSKISYVACNKTLEIKDLTIEVSSNNTSQLTEILNNPRIFFTKVNQTAYKKYQKMCE